LISIKMLSIYSYVSIYVTMLLINSKNMMRSNVVLIDVYPMRTAVMYQDGNA